MEGNLDAFVCVYVFVCIKTNECITVGDGETTLEKLCYVNKNIEIQCGNREYDNFDTW